MAARHSIGATPVSAMMKLGRTELFGMGIALALLGLPAWMMLAGMLIPFAPSAEWPKNVGLAGLVVPIVAGGTYLFRKGGGRTLMWVVLGWLLVAAIAGLYLAMVMWIGGTPRG
ncbi:hypothetical protein [Burkholderia cenocepacia]|uniref:hypothetical protein n=2 Tax=Burkholderia cenocepacia TaxID=95486 RepID=UPI001CF42E4D|nr:hypothetical protein [Burkholderia cenocepacia]MCA8237032.1 hypothetical protein [Burkholderia cenocepacia]